VEFVVVRAILQVVQKKYSCCLNLLSQEDQLAVVETRVKVKDLTGDNLSSNTDPMVACMSDHKRGNAFVSLHDTRNGPQHG
jgi:hypothetical protein